MASRGRRRFPAPGFFPDRGEGAGRGEQFDLRVVEIFNTVDVDMCAWLA